MAIIEANISELKKLAGKKIHALKNEELAHQISMMGLPVDKFDEESIYVEVSPNRPDCYCVEGLARSLETFLGQRKGLKEYSVANAQVELKVEKSAKLTPRPVIVAAVARGAKLDDSAIKSLIQVQEKLHDTLGRKRKKVAIGVHDLSKVKPHFHYRGVGAQDAKFVPLDFKDEKTLEEILLEHPKGAAYAKTLEGATLCPLITDSKGEVLSFPPIINGELTRVTENAKDLFVEITGTSVQAQTDALNIICCTLADRGAKIEAVRITGEEKLETPSLSPRKAKTSVSAIEKLLGISISQSEAVECLEKMGFAAKAGANGELEVLVPAYRSDVLHEVDVIEDIGIAFGFEKISGNPPHFATIGEKHSREEFADKVREIMIGLGFQDCITFLLSNEQREYARMQEKPSNRVEIANPLTQETTMLRNSLLPSLLGVLENNKTQKYPQKLFEAGEIILPDERDGNNACTVKKLCAVSSHKDANLAEMKSVIDALFRELGERAEISQGLEDQTAFFIEGRSASISAQSSKGGRKFTGFFGEVHPQTLENFGMEMPVAALEIWLEE